MSSVVCPIHTIYSICERWCHLVFVQSILYTLSVRGGATWGGLYQQVQIHFEPRNLGLTLKLTQKHCIQCGCSPVPEVMGLEVTNQGVLFTKGITRQCIQAPRVSSWMAIYRLAFDVCEGAVYVPMCRPGLILTDWIKPCQSEFTSGHTSARP